MSASGEVTRLLQAYREGDREAYDRLFPIVYDDLRRIARAHLRRQRSGHTLGTTGIVHEAYLKLVDPASNGYQDRNHFLAVAARAMRQVIISYARRHAAGKRGGGERALPLEALRRPLPERRAGSRAPTRLDVLRKRRRMVRPGRRRAVRHASVRAGRSPGLG